VCGWSIDSNRTDIVSYLSRIQSSTSQLEIWLSRWHFINRYNASIVAPTHWRHRTVDIALIINNICLLLRCWSVLCIVKYLLIHLVICSCSTVRWIVTCTLLLVHPTQLLVWLANLVMLTSYLGVLLLLIVLLVISVAIRLLRILLERWNHTSFLATILLIVELSVISTAGVVSRVILLLLLHHLGLHLLLITHLLLLLHHFKSSVRLTNLLHLS
jgi:hypothetical protein